MSKGIYIIGTDTDVGKTIISAGLMHLLLKSRVKAAYFKPVASGEIDVDGVPTPADAAFVSMASGFTEDLQLVTPFSFADSVAPHLASRIARRRIDRAKIRESLEDLKKHYDVIVAEGAGGLMVPLNDEGTLQYELIRELGFPCLLVTRAGLGTINHTLLTLRAAQDVGLVVKGIVVNGAGESVIEQDNISMIRKLSGIDAVFVLPQMAGVSAEKLQAGNLRDVFLQAVSINDIIALMDAI
jgi:dethiobiotin synthetase